MPKNLNLPRKYTRVLLFVIKFDFFLLETFTCHRKEKDNEKDILRDNKLLFMLYR